MKQTVYVYLTNADALEPFEEQCMALLTPYRRSIAQSYEHPAARRRCIASGLLLQSVLCVKTDADLEENEYGKPFLTAGGPHFNLTSSGGLSALAVSQSPVGADIEQVRAECPPILRRFFLPDELSWLDRSPSPERFYLLWTRLESVLKADGSGFSRWRQRTHSLLDPEGPWIIKGIDLGGYMLSCAAAEDFDLRFVDMSVGEIFERILLGKRFEPAG